MVETQEIRDAFAARLHKALDRMPGIRPARGRNVDLHAAIKAAGIETTTQATNKWLRGESMPEKDNMRQLAAWLNVRAEWLEYGDGEMIVPPSRAMLTGPELGAAIEAARIKKNIPKNALAKEFGVAAPSVNGWVSTGRIDKSKLIEVIRFFSDVVGPEHWGLTADDADTLQVSSGPSEAQGQADTAADAVLKMLSRHGKSLSAEVRQRILSAVDATTPEKAAGSANVIHADFSRSTTVKGNTVVLAQYDVRAAMGGGQLPAEYREFVRNLVVDKIQLDDLGLKYTSITNLKIISGWGQSMLGTIEDKSPVIVDVGVTSFVEEGVYVFTWLNHLYIKRVQMLDAERFMLVSDNKDFDPIPARMEDVHFHARVLGVWNFKRLS